MDNTTPNNSTLDTLKEFAISATLKEKSDKKFGEKIVLQVESLINSGYFNERNRRFALNRASAAGKTDYQKIFTDLLDMNGAVNYIKLNWKSIMIVNTIISRLVGRWMNNKLKPKAEAIDARSLKDKKDKVDDAEFYLDNKELLAGMQDQSGVPTVPQGQFVAEDKDHLDLWAKEELRLPEEILYEKGIRTVFKENKLESVTYRKLLHDAAEVGLVGIETYSEGGHVKTRRCVPENMIYSNSDEDNFSDTFIRGEIVSLTLSEVRSRYPHLKEDEIFEFAKVSKNWQENNKITFNQDWYTSLYRPYDDWNLDITNFELKTLDVDGYQMKVTKAGSLVIDKKKYKPENLTDNKEYTEKAKWNIYRGCYVRSGGKRTLLEWGEKKNKITPQDPQYIGEADFSYSFYMYQNVNMRNVAIPEKIEEPVEGMILTRLKIQQLVAKMRVSGYKYDIAGMQEMDLGNGKLSPLELQRVTDQTGNIYFRSRDAEGNRIENPIQENPNAGSVPQLQQLILLYNYHYQVLKDELGEDPNLMSQASTPRVTSENVKVSQQEADNATGHIEDAVIQCVTETANKVACLLHDSVEYGAEAYREIMQEKDVKGRVFKIIIEMLPNDKEIAEFIYEVNSYVMQHPDFILYISPFKLKTLAHENLRLAGMYFESAQKRSIKGQMQQAQHQSEMNGQIQQQSAQAKAQGDAQLNQMETQGKLGLSSQDFIQQALLLKMNPTNVTPPEVQALIDQYMANVAKAQQAAMQEEQQSQGMEEQQQVA